MTDLQELETRLGAVEDELAIRRVLLTYGPSADAGFSQLAASRWTEDGIYDWDADAEPYEGRAAVDAMLQGDHHRGLMATGVAHFAGPPVIEVDGDSATALTYSLIMRREPDSKHFYLWRVSAARWDLRREETIWAVIRRTNRLLDESGGGSELVGRLLRELYGDEAR